jgi:S1-C subfamily serine protease
MHPEALTQLANTLQGLPILGCSGGSPAARAGLCYGDIVLSVDGTPTPSWTAFLAATSASPLRLRVFRRGREVELTLLLDGNACTPRAVLEGPRRPELHADLS